MNGHMGIITLLLICVSLLAVPSSQLRAQEQQPPPPAQTGRNAYGAGMATDASFEYDPETGSLIVITDGETNEHIQKIIKNLDQPVPQVFIKVLFLEITHTNALDIGVEGSFSYGPTDARDTIRTAFGSAEETLGGFYTIVDEDWDILIHALATVTKLEVLSRPSILARNNEQATITVGQEVPFITNSRILDTGETVNTVEYRDIGIILTVTPRITPEKLVEMQVAPEISTLTGETVPISGGIDAPVIAKRYAETRVVVPDGKTVIMGGLMQDSLTESVHKIPLLGDIPLLGMAFKRTERNKSKTELLIFLTPYVLRNVADLANISAKEKTNLELTPKTFSGKQLDKYWTENNPQPESNVKEPF